MMALPKPYYETPLGKLYHGDCLEIMPHLGPVESVITDPVWPNNNVDQFKSINPFCLLKKCLTVLDCKRISIHLGCDSDPRILTSVPPKYEFIRCVWMRQPRPHFKGRILYGSDVAYLFGEVPKPRPGKFLIAGEVVRTDNKGKQFKDFPCERPIRFTQWLVDWMSEHEVLDPFLGSGTTAVACERLNRRWIGIEIEEKYCEIAKRRIKKERQQLKLF